MPIGSAAVYENISLPSSNYFTEKEYPFLSETAPLRNLQINGAWPAHCTPQGTTDGQLRVPDNYFIEQGSASYMPNNAAGGLRSDGNTIKEFVFASRCVGNGPIYGGVGLCTHSIYGSGVGAYCAHGGSGLSAVGGSLRLHEIPNTLGAIPHALKLTLPSTSLANCNGGYRWPAVTADSGYNNPSSWQYYNGSNCNFRMGSLVALLPTYTCPTATTLAGRVCQALKDYGAYVVDVHPSNGTGWNPLTINGEIGTQSSLDAIGSQLVPMITSLKVIANNASNNIGGGGTPRVPLAPPIGN